MNNNDKDIFDRIWDGIVGEGKSRDVEVRIYRIKMPAPTTRLPKVRPALRQWTEEEQKTWK